ncbi:unnamed protein product [Trichobilharzia regenti]|nr:unnamed protein product [Trichobilharzia regenti]
MVKTKLVQKKRVTVSESSSNSTSLQSITSQSKGTEPLRICEEEPKSSPVVIKKFENDEVDHTNCGKVVICDNGPDRARLSLADHDEMNGIPTTTELSKGSVQLENEVELNGDAMVEGMDTHETISVAHPSTDVKAEE